MFRTAPYRHIQPYVLILALICVSGASAQLYNTEIVADIQIERNSEFYTFTGTAENLTSAVTSLRYEFMVFKTDANNNRQNNVQENRFVMEANEKKLLSTLTINNNVTGKIILVLTIYDLEDKPIGQDRVVLSYDNALGTLELDDEKKKSPVIISLDQAAPQDGFSARGLIIKNTITKAGRDFHKYFYAEYLNKQIKTDKNIYIDEVPGRGRNTRITVKVEDRLVWQFFSQPRKTFLKQMATSAIARSIQRLQQLNKQKAELIRY